MEIKVINYDEYTSTVYVDGEFYGRLVFCEFDDPTAGVWVFGNDEQDDGEYVDYYHNYWKSVKELKEDIKKEKEGKMKEAKMAKVNFEKEEEDRYSVEVNGENYGQLIFDDYQKAWVLWSKSIDDGITYYEDLAECEEEIREEIANA